MRRILHNTEIPFAAILLFGLLAMTARNAVDPDLWWHLRTGQLIVESHSIPHSDPFSFTRAGHAWISHEWLSEVTFYELYKHGAAAALIVFSAIITTAGFMLLYLRCLPGGQQRHWAAAATALGALASAPSWGVRPQMFTFTLASLLLFLIERGEDRPKLLLWIPPLFLLWLNLHGGFALGPALLVAYAAGVLFETAAGNTSWQEARPILLRIFFVLVACLVLVPLNPSGTHLYRYPLDTLRSPGMRSFIAEWRSPDFHTSLYRPLLLLWLLLLIALATAHHRLKGRVIAPLLLTAFAALDASRHIPIFVLVAIPVVAAALPLSNPSPLSRPTSRRFRPAFSASAMILLALFALAKWTTLARHQNARVAQIFPQDAVEFLRAKSFPVNASSQNTKLFVYYDWGGYAIYNLYPRYRVFVDGRADLYGDDLMRDSVRTLIDLRSGWQDILNHWQIETILVPPSCALAQALLLNRHWQTRFSDSHAVIFSRSPSGAP
ncbi:MAG TPA: hypothetical protein VK828_11700 [Terriglobales bacterium]|jgi:hypothetical protein|nr:hypothetical protein [Terriglobales bacterium]